MRSLSLQEVFELAQKKWDAKGNVIEHKPEPPPPAAAALTGAAVRRPRIEPGTFNLRLARILPVT